MSNLNGGNVRSLMEAYHSIYEQPQEEMLTEEQIIVNEFCESWFQQCIDEDVDFSQYTQEDLIESIENYIQEAGNMGYTALPNPIQGISNWFNKNLQAWKDRGVSGKVGLNQKPTNTSVMSNTPPRSTTSATPPAPRRGQGNRSIDANPNRQGGTTIRNNGPSDGSAYDQYVKPNTTNNRSREFDKVLPTPKPNPTGGVTSAPTKRPDVATTPTPRPAATAAPTAPASGAMADKAPTPAKRPSILAGLDDLKRMRAASLMRQQGRNLPSGKIPVGDDLKPKS